ncbi:hypothetical protein F2Q69_00021156 [Brassica cretica]|uniref:alanine--glyoxylate transaminase n=1 Tax=Brassica cretica TaxID=69181 RepID=A0A8S9QDF1_BRACR|nr:hypothetical protein F2Q69_00021156 [Brassica cretica]
MASLGQITLPRAPSLQKSLLRRPIRTPIRFNGRIASVLTNAGSVKASVSQKVIEEEAKVLVGTYARAPVVLSSGKGCKLMDAEGKEYLDCASGIAVNALGHGDPDWLQAVTDQAALLAHVSNVYYTIPQIELAKRLVASSFADRVFFCNSGTEANEAAIKFSRKFQRFTHPEDKEVATSFIAFTNSFHGRTLGALALTSKEQYRTPFEPIMPGVTFLEYGNTQAATDLIRSGKIAAVFVEPIQGEGGVHSATKDFLQSLRSACDAAGSLLVFDEDPFRNRTFFWIGSGNPLVCSAAIAVFDKVSKPSFLASVSSKGLYFKDLLVKKLGGNLHVKEVRGEGLIIGVELDVPAGPLVDACRDSGLLILTAGKGNVVRIVPPLIISEEEIERAVEIIFHNLTALD